MDVHFHATQLNENAFVSLPSSKSLSHRALIAAALANGDSFIQGISESKDTKATMNVLEHLGISFERNDSGILVHGCGGKFNYDGEVLDCNESGSTLRFLIPLASLCGNVSFCGHGRLMERPQTVYEDIYKEHHLLFEKEDGKLSVKGPLPADIYTVKGDISSQFITGLLFTLPLLNADSVIQILPPFESASYVDLTLDTLRRSSIQFEKNDLIIKIPGNQIYQPIQCKVEGDDSQMAFFCELGLIQHRAVSVLNVNHDSHQGDHVIIDIAKRMGATVEEIENGYLFNAKELKATEIDLQDCPDLGPALFALATQCKGTTTFIHCERLRIKESDRIEAMECELRKLGCNISSSGGTVTVTGPTTIRQHVRLNGHNDHRIVMSLAMLATLSDDIIIEGSEAVEKSYPCFFEDLRKMGVNYD